MKIKQTFLALFILSLTYQVHASELSEHLASSRRVSCYQVALYGVTLGSFFSTLVGALWAPVNAKLPNQVASVSQNQASAAHTIFAVSVAETAVSALTFVVAGSLTLKAMHQTKMREMHEAPARNFVTFREFFVTGLMLVQVGLHTWVGVEIRNLRDALGNQAIPLLADEIPRYFWIVTGELIATTLFSAFVPVFGEMLVKHPPLS